MAQTEIVDETNFLEALIQRQREGMIDLVTTPVRAWVMLAAIQLAVRHPEFPASVSEIVIDIGRNLQLAIGEKGSPLWNLAEKGWDPKYDVKFSEGR